MKVQLGVFSAMAILMDSVSSFQPVNMKITDASSLSAVSRRDWLVVGASAAALTFSSLVEPAFADDEPAVLTLPKLEMKEFVDPQGLFSISVPKNFYTLRRTQKGDLPDAKTGKGRRGSSIFTAGDLGKAEVVAVERYPTQILLEENGIDSSGDLSTFAAIGEPRAVATLLILRREKETQRVGVKVLDDAQVSPDGKELTFRLRTEIDVQKPELLMEEIGVSQLFRITLAKATLNSNDGNIMAVFASALEIDFANGVDGPALEDTVKSFVATNQAS